MDIDQLELAARKAWPALEELESKHGVLRYAAGASRRANSLSPSVVGMRAPARLMQMSESWFYPRGLPSILRYCRRYRLRASCFAPGSVSGQGLDTSRRQSPWS